MSDGIFRRCGCRGPDGKQLGSKCPKLKADRRHGSWGFVISAPAASDDLPLQIRRSGFETRKAAEQARDTLRVEVASGRRIERGSGTLTVAEFLRSWLREREQDGDLKASTLSSYRASIEQIWVPRVGKIRLEHLTGRHVDAALRGYKAAYEARYGPMRASTLGRHRAPLNAALSKAVRQRLVPFNAAAESELGRKVDRPKLHPLEPAELGRLLDSIQGDPLAPLIEVAAFTGMRRGELLGLRWADVDLEKRQATIRQTVVVVEGKLRFETPKTEAGQRVVPLSEAAIASLMAHRVAQEIERGQLVEAYDDHDLVFAEPTGAPIGPWRVSSRFGELCDQAGVRRVRFHDLRHGYASLALAAGADMVTVSKTLGHSKLAVTSDLYSHMVGDLGSRVAEAVAAMVPRRGEGLTTG